MFQKVHVIFNNSIQMTKKDLLYTLALLHVPHVGDIIAKRLINRCGSAEAVFKEARPNLSKIEGIGGLIVNAIFNSIHLKAAEEEMAFIEKNKIKTSYFKDQNYPEKLKYCADGPVILFETGAIHFNNHPIISIVGTRKITTNGIAFCEALIEQIAPYNPIIVSGFAYGTDITAHKMAVKQKLQTIACLAHGFHMIYPKAHKKYVNEVNSYGGFLTDFWSCNSFDRNNFLKRNRIIAGLSQATVVIESAEKGGSLVTADIANSYNRDVFALPGRVTDSQSLGCNNLIKYHKAHILTTPLDVPYILNWTLEHDKKPAIQKQLFVALDASEKTIYKFLKQANKQQLDAIALNCKMPIFKVASILFDMELKGVIRPLPGKLFEVI